jgi:hypothetical protein
LLDDWDRVAGVTHDTTRLGIDASPENQFLLSLISAEMNLHWLLARFAAIIAFALASLPCVVSAELPPAPQQIGTSTFKFSGTWVMSADGDADDYWLYFTRPEDRSEAFHRDEDDLYAFEIVEEGEWTLRIGVEDEPQDCTDACIDAEIVSVEEKQPGVFYISVRKPGEDGVEAVFIFRGGCGVLLPPSNSIIPTLVCVGAGDICRFTWGVLTSCLGTSITSFLPFTEAGPVLPGSPGSGFVVREVFWHSSDTLNPLPQCDYFQATPEDATTPIDVFLAFQNNASCGFRTGVASLKGQSRGFKELKAYAALGIEGYAKAAAEATPTLQDDGQMAHSLAGASDVVLIKTGLVPDLTPVVVKYTYQITGTVKKEASDAITDAGSFIRGAVELCPKNFSSCSAEFGDWDGPGEKRTVPFEFEFKKGEELFTTFELVASVVAAADRASTALRHSADVRADFGATAKLARIQLFEGTIDNLGPEIHDFTIDSESGEDYNVFIDTVPPVTTASVAGTPGNNGWFRSAVSVSLAATDGVAGVLGSFVGVDGAAPAAYTGPVAIATDGLHNVAFYSVDAAGNVEPMNTITLRIDKTAPVVTPPASITVQATQADGARPGSSPALATFVSGGSATDAQDTAPVKLPPTLAGATIEGTTLFTIGVNVVRFEFTDAAGNTGAATATVTVTAPVPPPTMACDADGDADVDTADLQVIRQGNGLLAQPGDVRDGNQDGRINVADVRYCQLRLTSIQ